MLNCDKQYLNFWWPSSLSHTYTSVCVSLSFNELTFSNCWCTLTLGINQSTRHMNCCTGIYYQVIITYVLWLLSWWVFFYFLLLCGTFLQLTPLERSHVKCRFTTSWLLSLDMHSFSTCTCTDTLPSYRTLLLKLCKIYHYTLRNKLV